MMIRGRLYSTVFFHFTEQINDDDDDDDACEYFSRCLYVCLSVPLSQLNLFNNSVAAVEDAVSWLVWSHRRLFRAYYHYYYYCYCYCCCRCPRRRQSSIITRHHHHYRLQPSKWYIVVRICGSDRDDVNVPAVLAGCTNVQINRALRFSCRSWARRFICGRRARRFSCRRWTFHCRRWTWRTQTLTTADERAADKEVVDRASWHLSRQTRPPCRSSATATLPR